MSKEDMIRAALHLPVGLFVAWVMTVNATAGWINGLSFLAYEVLNDWRKHDHSYKDVFGYCIGLGIGTVLFGNFLQRLFG